MKHKKISTAKIILIVGSLWFIVHVAISIIDGLADRIEKADVAVVLGNKVELDGTPSLRLKSRLDKGAQLYRTGYVNKIFVSGGVGVEGYDEAVVMKQYLVENGIPSTAIITDSDGNNTYLTARNLTVYMQKEKLNSAIVVSQYYHISRTKLILKKFGISTVYSAHARLFPELGDLLSVPREFFAFYSYLFKSTP